MPTFFGSWDVYSATSTGTAVTLTSTTPAILADAVENQSGGDTSTIMNAGDIFVDSVTESAFTYEGSIAVNTTSGTVEGFVGDVGGNFFVFVPANSAVAATSGAPITAPSSWPMTECFLAGTMIGTPDGERAVETLAAGDMVLTAGGAAKPVRWLGMSTRSRQFSDPARVLPTRIKAGALGENLPIRDLLVSPGHAMLVDGVLVHASALVNGSSVVRDTATAAVFTYYHVELDSHDLLLAEGAASESYLSGAENMGFDNLADRPAAGAMQVEMDLPRVKSARQLPASVRELLAARAAMIAPDVQIAA